MRFKILFVIFFAVSFFSLRFPSYNLPLDGEDGIFADLFINAPKGPLYGQTARVKGVEIYSYLSHPAPLYEWMGLSGKFFTAILPIKEHSAINSPDLAAYLRFSFSCFQFFAWCLLLAYLLTLPKEKFKWSDLFFFLLLAVSPPFINHSIWLQTDNASGSFLIGCLMFIILIWDRYKDSSFLKMGSLLFVAGFISAMGKNEWSILMFLSILATSAFVFLKTKKTGDDSKQEFHYLQCLLAGLVIGNLVSYLFDPVNYLGGLGLVNHMSQSASVMSSNQMGSWWTVTKNRVPFIYLGVALWLYISSMFMAKSPWKISTPTILAFFISSALLWSFFLTSWDTTDRYFIPAFIALVFTLMLVRTSIPHLTLNKWTLYICLFLGLDITHNNFISWRKHNDRIAHYADYLDSLPKKEGCIHHINYYAFNLKKIDYVGIGNGMDNLNAHLSRSGMVLCEE